MEYYWQEKVSNKLFLCDVVAWMNLNSITLRERSQVQRTHVVSFHVYEMPRKDKFTETKSKLVVGFLGRGVGMGINCRLTPGKLSGDRNDQNFDNVCMTL